MSPNSIASAQAIASILREMPNQVSPIMSQPPTPIIIPPPTPFASGGRLLRSSVRSQHSLVLPPTPFANGERLLQRSTRSRNSLAPQANLNSSTPSSPLSKNINIRLVANGSRTPICYVSSNRSVTKTQIQEKRSAATVFNSIYKEERRQ
ncbi:uncharacterized protein LOC116348959 [Contarinia nasturtii]|uniref:uncharacterized protein LOC116348959 n=1 Tax=Contarinia nasturtii TaxID=265458 RepID=UPI0012D43D4D|nr:uncharacterized protein LOC116348959 [Contarinia nasturtii]XP_031636065.1 uncharacterized protein LOC116348959 [Contarinia nasturtii]